MGQWVFNIPDAAEADFIEAMSVRGGWGQRDSNPNGLTQRQFAKQTWGNLAKNIYLGYKRDQAAKTAGDQAASDADAALVLS